MLKILVALRSYPNSRAFSFFLGMIIFWITTDAILSYIAPVVIQSQVKSNLEVGIILGTSSLAGGLFDAVLSYIIRRPSFRRFFLAMLLLTATATLLLWQGSTFAVFLLVMALWGFYYDLYHFGSYDFISKYASNKDVSREYSFLLMTIAVGALLGSLIAGALVGETVNPTIYLVMLSFILLAAFMYIGLFISTYKDKQRFVELDADSEIKTIKRELKVWRVILITGFPAFFFVVYFHIYDAFFLTIGPLLAESLDAIKPFNGLLIAAYWLPTFVASLYINKLTRRIGKKRTAFLGLLLAGIPLSLVGLTTVPAMLILLILASAMFSTLSLPSISAAFNDYISENRHQEEEIAALQDFACNLGYILGPIIAGFIADNVGYNQAFSILGITSIIVSAILLVVTPRKINFKF